MTNFFMRAALERAAKALDLGEFPVGCIIVHGKEILASGERTGTVSGGNEVDHAEMNALRRLSAAPAGIDLKEAVLYCTLEPCLMCYSAIILSGIGRIVYAYEDAMGGARESISPAVRPFTGMRRSRWCPGCFVTRAWPFPHIFPES